MLSPSMAAPSVILCWGHVEGGEEGGREGGREVKSEVEIEGGK